MLYVERAALDDSGQLLVQGWVVSLTAVVTVQVFIDEENIGAAQLGGQRDDVGTAFPAYSNASLSGFALSKHIDVASATVSTLRVQAISLNGSSCMRRCCRWNGRARWRWDNRSRWRPNRSGTDADPVIHVAAARLSFGDKLPAWS